MPGRDFQGFMKMMARKIYPASDFQVSQPQSPPNWQEIGWQVGWIIEESYTGLQWWVTSEEGWEELSAELGSDNQQKTQTFVNWYVKRLKQVGRKYGVPVRLESVRWRRIDFRAIADRPRIVDGNWWQVTVDGQLEPVWQVLLPGRFLKLFEKEEKPVSQARLPWKFSELWEKLSADCRTRVMQKIGPEIGLLNHLAGLIAAGTLKQEEIFENIQSTPFGELKEILERRRAMLKKQEGKARRQTVDKWKEDAELFLAKRVGDWLEEGSLRGEGWKSCNLEWQKYRLRLLRDKYSTEKWKKMWQSLSDKDLRQLIPRLDFKALSPAFSGLAAHVRASVGQILPDSEKNRFKKASEGSYPPEQIFAAREKIYKQGKNFLKKSDFELDGDWELKK